jgi:pyruvate dehydrogenase E2 component (dihydrolipoamide acetyltransferase)
MPEMMNMPKIGVNMTEAVILEWKVKEGDVIKEGDHILDAETDKAVQEIFATDSGVIEKILVGQGEKAICQEPLILFETGEAAPVTIEKQRIRISPLAKKIAKDNGIDISDIRPAKSGDRIIKADVLRYIEENKVVEAVSDTVKQTGRYIELSGTRAVIAKRMSESNTTKPSAALTLRADADELVMWRNRLKEQGHAVSYNDILVLICAKALKEHPMMNSRFVDDRIEMVDDINIGVAVDTEKGLMVPVIHSADKKGLLDISRGSKEKALRAQAGKAAADDITGGTFTITNLGMYEIEQFTPVINPPECAILAAGAITKEPVVSKDTGRFVAKERIQLTLVFDHRIVDGAPAAKFLQRIKHLIEWPLGLNS